VYTYIIYIYIYHIISIMWYDMCPFFVANLLSKNYRLISVVAIWVHQTLFFCGEAYPILSNSFWYLFPFKSYFFMCTQLQVPFMKSNGFSLTMRTFTKKKITWLIQNRHHHRPGMLSHPIEMPGHPLQKPLWQSSPSCPELCAVPQKTADSFVKHGGSAGISWEINIPSGYLT